MDQFWHRLQLYNSLIIWLFETILFMKLRGKGRGLIWYMFHSDRWSMSRDTNFQKMKRFFSTFDTNFWNIRQVHQWCFLGVQPTVHSLEKKKAEYTLNRTFWIQPTIFQIQFQNLLLLKISMTFIFLAFLNWYGFRHKIFNCN